MADIWLKHRCSSENQRREKRREKHSQAAEEEEARVKCRAALLNTSLGRKQLEGSCQFMENHGSIFLEWKGEKGQTRQPRLEIFLPAVIRCA